ncbi:hypothetical protein PV08_03550 [Exophiala spinifera]|uniref:Clr5 domain-containing protein n=1 Tax=Exophiala spinifera TaxID=91928 RepID=A0A0D1YVD6_9EURO|nr:uncharacterized protein PV08_03550 [Exophiala spinifera]KIW19256.1 hypothetical protein PV08_03550 [Exophiala spinifera]
MTSSVRGPDEEEWLSHKPFIKKYYIEEGRTLNWVREELMKQYSFDASTDQHKRKLKSWGFIKNCKASDWRGVGKAINRRGLKQDAAQVKMYGRTVSKAKVARGIRRHDMPSMKRKWSTGSSPWTPDHVLIAKPSPQNRVHLRLDLPGLRLLERILYQSNSFANHKSQPSSRPADSSGLIATSYRPGFRVEPSDSAAQATQVPIANSLNYEQTRQEQSQYPSTVSHEAEGYDHFTEQSPSTIVAPLLAETHCEAFLPQESVHLLDACKSQLCSPGLVGDLALIGYAIYFLSNNHLSYNQLRPFLDFMVNKPLSQLRHALSSIHSQSLQPLLDRVLLYAAMHDRVEVLDLLCHYGYDLSRTIRGEFESKPTTAMHKALECKDVAFCNRLIELGVNLTATPLLDEWDGMDTNRIDWTGKMPYETSTIFLAAEHLPDLVIAQLPNLAPSLAGNLLPVAVQAGMDMTGIAGLLSNGADINGIDGKLWTALHYAISREDVSLTQYLLNNGACPDGRSIRSRRTGRSVVPLDAHTFSDDDWRSSFLFTPLMLSIQLENSILCEILIKARANVNLSMEERLLDFFLHDTRAPYQSYLCVEDIDDYEVIDFGFWPCTKDFSLSIWDEDHHPFRMRTALELAAAHGSTMTLEMLLQNWADLSRNYTTSPLALSAAFGQVQDVQLLLDYGVPPENVADGKCELSPLRVACLRGHAEIVSTLIEAGACVDGPCEGPTPLQCAASKGNVDVVRLLLNRGAGPDAAPDEHYGFTALQAALDHHQTKVIDFLLEYGVNLTAPAGLGSEYAVLRSAIEMRHLDLFNGLICAGTGGRTVEWNGDHNWDLLLSMAPGASCNDYLLLLHGQFDFDQRLQNGRTFAEDALLEAASCRRYECIKILLRQTHNFRPDILTQALNSLTPWSSDQWDVVMELLDRGGKVCGREGESSPLIFQAETLQLMGALIAKGANVNEPRSSYNSDSMTALQLAVERQDMPMVEFLLGKGAEINVAPGGTRTALQMASSRGSIPMVEFLLSKGADINAPPAREWGRTALQEASENGNMCMLKFLLRKGANINAPPAPHYGRTALQAASEKGNSIIIKFLLDHGADVNAPACMKRGVTALQAASIRGYIGIAEVLLHAGADIGAPAAQEDGRTALNGAAEHGRLDMVKLLLDNYRVKDGESLSQLCDEATQYARREYHWGVVELLEKYQRPPNFSP